MSLGSPVTSDDLFETVCRREKKSRPLMTNWKPVSSATGFSQYRTLVRRYYKRRLRDQQFDHSTLSDTNHWRDFGLALLE